MQELQCLGKLPIFFLTVWHFAFFWNFYENPNLLATSEVLSNYYPFWTWLGRQLKRFRIPLVDNIYYRYPSCIPFLSVFYPPYFLTSLFSSFRLYSILILSHYLLGSYLAFIMLSQYVCDPVALFGAISLVYNAYNIKLQTPCFSFTSCWIMGILLPFPYGAICFGMAILGGYWPILITMLPITLLNPSCMWGVILGIPQIIPFLWYFPKSIRAVQKPDRNYGKMPIWRFFVRTTFPSNGVHYPELVFGVGLCSFLWIKTISIWWLFALIGFLGTQGYPLVARIPSRFLYLLGFSLIMASLMPLNAYYSHLLWTVVVTTQVFLLWPNRGIYPHFPYSQWWRKPDMSIYTGKLWPNNTGYMHEEHHQDYFGGFSLAENYHG